MVLRGWMKLGRYSWSNESVQLRKRCMKSSARWRAVGSRWKSGRICPGSVACLRRLHSEPPLPGATGRDFEGLEPASIRTLIDTYPASIRCPTAINFRALLKWNYKICSRSTSYRCEKHTPPRSSSPRSLWGQDNTSDPCCPVSQRSIPGMDEVRSPHRVQRCAGRP